MKRPSLVTAPDVCFAKATDGQDRAKPPVDTNTTGGRLSGNRMPDGR